MKLALLSLLLTLPAPEQKSILDEQKQIVEQCDGLIKTDPKRIAAYSRRGDAHVFLANWKAAKSDYEQMIKLDPAQDVPHWRLGIVYFALEDYDKGAKQFAKYHAYDDRDRENGVWHFFCLAKATSLAEARKSMLPYTKFDRHPFPDVYEMLAGTITPKEAQLRQEKRDAASGRSEQQRFFLDLYLGMFAWLENRPSDAAKHLAAATENSWGRGESDRTYMWQVARVLHDAWITKLAKP